MKTYRAALIALLVAGAAFGQSNLPELPRILLDTHYTKPTGATTLVTDPATLQATVDAAKPGDTIVLQSGTTYGPVLLGNKAGTDYITITSSNPAALVPEGVRTQPGLPMARIQTSNSNPAVATADNAHNWRIMGVEIAMAPTLLGCYSLVAIDTSGPAAAMPHDIIIDRSYLHGNALGACRRALQLGGFNVSLVDSYLSGMHVVYGRGTESQAIASYNGPGPYKLDNNYLEGSTENVIFGGSVGSVWRVIPSDIQITHNTFRKPLAWRNGIIPAPATTVTTDVGGSLPVGHYWYQVVAHGTAGSDYGVLPIVSGFSEVGVDVVTLGDAPALKWPVTTYGDPTDPRVASSYTVYRTQDAATVGTARNFTTYEVPTGTTFKDTGATGTAFVDANSIYQPYRKDGDAWSVKNMLEFKCGQRVLVEGNEFDGSWVNGQSGTVFTITPRSVIGPGWSADYILKYGFPGAISSDITIRNNYAHNVASLGGIASSDNFCTTPDCGISARVMFDNNLSVASSDFAAFGKAGGSGGVSLYGTNDFTARNNTIIVDGVFSGAVGFVEGATVNTWFQDNLLAGDASRAIPLKSPLLGPDAVFFAGEQNMVFKGNVIVKNQPYTQLAAWQARTDNQGVASLEQVGFVDIANGNYALAATSPYVGKGVDMAKLNAALNRTSPITIPAISAPTPATPAPVPPSTIDTAKLTAAMNTVFKQMQAQLSQLQAIVNQLIIAKTKQ